MDQEITEKLVRGNEEKKPERSNNKKVILIIGLAVMLLAAASFGIYYYQNIYKYNKALEIAQSYINDNDYENAILSFQEAIDIAPKKTEAYIDLAEVAVLADKIELAQETYEKLYEITNDSKYVYQATSVESGINIGNASNGGYVIEQGGSVYLLENENKTVNVWNVSDDNEEFMNQIFYDQEISGTDPFMNVWGSNYYLDLRGVIQKLTLGNKITDASKNMTEYSNKVTDFQIYDNEIYYLEGYSFTQNSLKRLCKQNVNGGITEYLPVSMNYFEHIYLVDGMLFYLISDNNSNTLYQTSLDSIAPQVVYHDDNRQIFNVSYSDKKLFFNFRDTTDSTGSEYYPEIGVYDTELNAVTIEQKGSPVSVLNTNAENIFYISEGKLYKEKLDFSGKEELFTLGFETNRRTAINLTANNIYLVSYDYTKAQTTFGSNTEYKVAVLNKPNDFHDLELVAFPEMSEEVKAAYEEYIPTVFKTPDDSTYSQQLIEGNKDSSTFFYYDMNEDGTPELVINQYYGGDLSLYHFLTYKDGEVVEISEPVQAIMNFSGEDSPTSGRLISYKTMDFGKSYEKSYINFDGTKIEFEPIETVYKTGVNQQIMEGYSIPMSNVKSDTFFR